MRHAFEDDAALTATGVKTHLTSERMNDYHSFDTILPSVPGMLQLYFFQVRCLELSVLVHRVGCCVWLITMFAFAARWWLWIHDQQAALQDGLATALIDTKSLSHSD